MSILLAFFCHLCWPSDLPLGVVVRLLPSVGMKIRGNGRAFQRISAFIIFIPSHQHYSENPGNSIKVVVKATSLYLLIL